MASVMYDNVRHPTVHGKWLDVSLLRNYCLDDLAGREIDEAKAMWAACLRRRPRMRVRCCASYASAQMPRHTCRERRRGSSTRRAFPGGPASVRWHSCLREQTFQPSSYKESSLQDQPLMLPRAHVVPRPQTEHAFTERLTPAQSYQRHHSAAAESNGASAASGQQLG